MRDTLEDLYFGNITPNDQIVKSGTALKKAMEQSAEAGNQYAQYMLGKLYLTGQGVTHDQTRAMAWFSRSAAQGEPVRPALFGVTKRPPSALHYVGGHPPALPHEPAL